MLAEVSPPPLTPPRETTPLAGILLDTIEVENFKSYAGIVRIGPFHERLTAIVGPNGSGKSNIIDSLLFVFGRRAGQLREKNLTGLIHSSRDCKPDSARVTLHFVDNTRVRLFELCREVQMTGNSRYIIDGQQVTYHEMTKFVKSHGIDLDHNRFLILQGEVESLSTLPPKASHASTSGLLEILEDLFGSNDLIPLIEEKEEKCESLKEAVEASDTVLSRCALELTSLVGPCREAFGYISCHKNLLAAKADLACKEVWKLREQREQLSSSIKEITAAREAISDHAHFKELEECRRAFQKNNEDHEALLRESEQTRKRISSLQLEEDRMAAAIASQKRALQEYEASEVRLTDEAAAKEKEAIKILEEGEYWRDKGLAELRLQLAALKDEISALDSSLIAERDCANKRLQVLVEERDSVAEKRVADINKQVEESKKRKELIQRELAERDLRQLKGKLRDCRENIQAKIAKIDELCANRDEIRKAVRLRTEATQKMQTRLTELETRRQELMSKIGPAVGAAGVGSRTSVLLTRLKREFGDSSSPLYRTGYWLLDYVDCSDVDRLGAALTAGGLGEDVILTEADEDSEQIILFVKRHTLGRVTCVTIGTAANRWRNFMRDWEKKVAAGREQYDRALAQPLMSLVKVLPFKTRKGDTLDITPLVWSRLRDTLICTGGDIHVAKRIAFGSRERYRVVTLKGEVIEKNGSMTGGSAINYLKQRKNMFSANNNLNDNQSQRQRWEVELKDAEEEIDKINFAMRNSSFDEKRVDQQLSEMQKDITSAVADGKDLETTYTDLKAVYIAKQDELNSAENQQKFQKLENDLKNLSADLSKLEQSKSKATLILTQLQNNIHVETEKLKNIGGIKRHQLQDKKTELDREIATKTDMVNNMVSLSSAAKQRAAQILENLLPEAKTRVRAAVTELQAKDEALVEAVALLKEVNEEYNLLIDRVKKSEETLLQLRDSKTKCEKSVRMLRAEDAQLEAKASDMKVELNSVDRNIANKVNIVKQLQVEFDEFIDFDETNVKDLKQDEEGGKVETGTENVDQSDQTQITAKVERIDFPNIENESRYAEKPTSEFQLEVHRWTENVEVLGNTTMDITVLTRFQAKNEEYIKLKAERDRRKSELETHYGELRATKDERRRIFDLGFAFLTSKVKELYQMLTRGGDAELEFKACHCPFAEGIEFSVRPPGKSWRSITALSGGEKTLSSLALIFALHHYKPTPIYVLDEIDAALDSQNVILIASYVAACQATNAQFIVISLRHEFYQRADRLIGVCKVADKTQICSIDPDLFTEQENKRHRLPESAAESVAD